MRWTIIVPVVIGLLSACGGSNDDNPPNNDVQSCASPTTIGQDLVLADEATIRLEKCAGEVTGDVVVDGTAVSALDLPHLSMVRGDFLILNNPNLAYINLPVLETVIGELDLRGNPEIATLNTPTITSLGDLRMGQVDAIPVAMPQLTAVQNNFQLDDNDTPTADFSALGSVGFDLVIFGNDNLANLDGFVELDQVGQSFFIEQNGSLPTCAAEGLRDQITGRQGIGGTIRITDNDDDGTCM